MTTSPDALLDQLMSCTLALEESIRQEETDPDEWVKWLEEREQIIDKLEILKRNNVPWTTEARRKRLQQIYEIDMRIFPLMKEKQDQIKLKLKELQQVKKATNHYTNAYAVTEYGAFFDKRK